MTQEELAGDPEITQEYLNQADAMGIVDDVLITALVSMQNDNNQTISDCIVKAFNNVIDRT